MRTKEELLAVKRSFGGVGALDFLIARATNCVKEPSKIPLKYREFWSKAILVEEDLSKYEKPPANWPKDVILPPLNGPGNNYTHLLRRIDQSCEPKISIIVLTYNRDPYLARTLTGIANQNYPLDLIEVIVTDDGGSSSALDVVRRYQSKLDLKYCWHKDIGFTPAVARNKAIAMASHDFIIQLDVDMYPDPGLVRAYADYEPVLAQVALIGPRKYVDLTNVRLEVLQADPSAIRTMKEVVTNNDVAGKVQGAKSVDWRLDSFEKTAGLQTERVPFRFFAAGNVAFSKRRFLDVGGYDERFRTWGHEDGELAFRFYQSGLYFIPVKNAWAYHQEPENGENETHRSKGHAVSGQLYGQICPFYRGLLKSKRPIHEVPWVSIYIPAYNAESTICDAISSALGQTYSDLEVCVCNDGSTDRTLGKVQKYFGRNRRVRIITQANSGIGAASNRAVSTSKGVFIGQLDSDDYLAKDAVERCMDAFQRQPAVGVVYTSYENEHQDGRVEPGYNYPIYNRYKLMTSMIAHHFRMFRRRDWARVGGFNCRMKNAVDFDFFLRLSEICDFTHLNIRAYRRRLHGSNTSTVDFLEQNTNAAKAVNESLMRQSLALEAIQISAEKTALKFKPRQY